MRKAKRKAVKKKARSLSNRGKAGKKAKAKPKKRKTKRKPAKRMVKAKKRIKRKRKKSPVKKKAAKKRPARRKNKPARKKKAVKKKTVKKKLKKRPVTEPAVKKEVPEKPVSAFEESISKVDQHIQEYKKALETGMPVKEDEFAPPEELVRGIEKEIKPIEEGVEELKEEFSDPKKKSPMLFYFISSFICVALLAYLFGTFTTGVFYFMFGTFLWWWSHQFHITRSSVRKAFLSLGVIVILLYIATWYFNDLLSIIFCVIYVLSLLIAGFLYFYHVKRDLSGEIHQSFSRTFLVVFYSHIMALAAASLTAYLLSFIIISDSFISIAFLIVAWLLPVLLVYFFFTRFLYLRFFDRKHVRMDLMKGLKHGVAYCLVLIALLVLGYLLTAFQFAGEERANQDALLGSAVSVLEKVRPEIMEFVEKNNAEELLGMKVTNDVILFADRTAEDAISLRKRLRSTDFSFYDYARDSYFTRLSQQRLSVSEVMEKSFAAQVMVEDLLREYERMKLFSYSGEFDDGSANLKEHLFSLTDYINTVYVPYEEPRRFTEMRKKVSLSMDSYSALNADGWLLEFNRQHLPDVAVFLPGRSRFSKRFYDVMHHTVLYRDLMVFVFDSVLRLAEEAVSPYYVGYLYDSAVQESEQSRVLRYRIIKSNYDATLSLFE